MRISRWGCLILAGIGLSVILVAGCGGGSKPATQEKVVFAHPVQDLNTLPIQFGQAKGIFAQEGLDVQFNVMKTDTIVAGMLAGEVDYTGVSTIIVSAALKQAPVKLISYLVDKSTFSLWGQPQIKSVKDLKGKVIAITAVEATQIKNITAIMQANGMRFEDVTLLGTGTMPNTFTTLKSGQVAAAILAPTLDIQAESEGFTQLARVRDYLNQPMSGISTTDKKIKENPEQIKKFLQGTFKTLRYMKEHPQEVIDYIASTQNLSPELAKKAYQSMESLFTKDGTASEEVQREQIATMAAQLQLSRSIPLSTVYDFSLLRQVQQ